MGSSVISTLRDTIKSFNFQDDQLARQVLRSDDVVDALYHQIVQDMLSSMETDSQKVNSDLAYIMIAKNLERIADHCTNIAENVIYVASREDHSASARGLIGDCICDRLPLPVLRERAGVRVSSEDVQSIHRARRANPHPALSRSTGRGEEGRATRGMQQPGATEAAIQFEFRVLTFEFKIRRVLTKRRTCWTMVVMLALLASLHASSPQPNLVTNGGFEDEDIGAMYRQYDTVVGSRRGGGLRRDRWISLANGGTPPRGISRWI